MEDVPVLVLLGQNIHGLVELIRKPNESKEIAMVTTRLQRRLRSQERSSCPETKEADIGTEPKPVEEGYRDTRNTRDAV